VTRVIIFAKAPQAGFAKTRLIPALGKDGAAALARKMLIHTLVASLDAKVNTVELCVTPHIDETAWNDISLPTKIEVSHQGEGDLGDRLSRAAERSIAKGESVILVGTDCIEMSGSLLSNAAQNLVEHDAVINCTTDGGYALLGFKQHNRRLFCDMPWSTAAVARTTIERIAQLGWKINIGQMLHDVDVPRDLQFIPKKWNADAVA